jgi:class 3 adenylate cyclase
VVAALRRARRALPGDPYFGDRLSTSGFGGPAAAARAADRLLGDRDAASREISLGALQVWQALTDRVGRKPAQDEVTLVFTDLVDFSRWALEAGDDATLKLLRQVAQVVEPPLLEVGGQVVKRMGDGIMACFPDQVTAIAAVSVAREALKSVEVDGYTPVMRVGIHTGRPQRIGSDWLGVDVNIAARVMECASKGGVLISGATLEHLTPEQLDELGVAAKRLRRPLLAHRLSGVPSDITIYRLETRRDLSAAHASDDRPPQE